ncbi:hypothetical protein L0668_08800 [Paraglaciecola aquimarina]|uniref:Lipoprotein n=1 Tax=Paraglaciecola algarum TaxID=3050085 RepID=A0ABS9D5Q3_9ALTE|nr:hypothetical protein [Paraglaciecola sp. G1-23]MCF2948201.1 hypothetical protein [Paraglaciecola sp. G1-23]
MKRLIAVGMALLSMTLLSCTTKQAQHFVGAAIADGADTQVRYSASQCRTLRMQCVQGDFQEWETSEKEMGCSCKKL